MGAYRLCYSIRISTEKHEGADWRQRNVCFCTADPHLDDQMRGRWKGKLATVSISLPNMHMLSFEQGSCPIILWSRNGHVIYSTKHDWPDPAYDVVIASCNSYNSFLSWASEYLAPWSIPMSVIQVEVTYFPWPHSSSL